MDIELEEQERRSLESHLELCPSCRTEFDSLLASYQLVERLQAIRLPRGSWERVAAEIQPTTPILHPFWPAQFLKQAWPAAAATAAVFLIVLSLSLFSWVWTPVSQQPDLQEQLNLFIQERDKERLIFLKERQARNPFEAEVVPVTTNPFSTE